MKKNKIIQYNFINIHHDFKRIKKPGYTNILESFQIKTSIHLK